MDQISPRHRLQRLVTDAPKASAAVTFDAMGDGVTFLTEPMKEPTEITGLVAAKLQISSSTADADIFGAAGVAPDMKEVVFQGALDPGDTSDRARMAAGFAS